MSTPDQNLFAAFAFKGRNYCTNVMAAAKERVAASSPTEEVDSAVSSKQSRLPAEASAYKLSGPADTHPTSPPAGVAADAENSPQKRSTSRRIAAAAAAAAAVSITTPTTATTSSAPKRQRKAYASLTGLPKGLPEKLGSAPLRLILVGHNPSEHAWHTGHYYSNPSNRMWRTLISTGIAPAGATGCEADDSMPAAVGVGFTDVGSGQPGTDSSLFTGKDFQRWRSSFYSRLRAHMQEASDSIGCTCGQCGAPALVAFTGKRHYLELLNLDHNGQQLRGKDRHAAAAVQLGPQPSAILPDGWPLPRNRTEVWVLTSTSGAAPMTNEERERPYRQLAQRLHELPWPRAVQLTCKATKAS